MSTLGVLLLVVPALVTPSAPARAPALPAVLPVTLPCDGPDADPWVVDFRSRVMGYNGLAAFAVSTWGDPVSCDGEETMEFDGTRYGTLTLTFAEGVTLVVETQPIETSIVTLRSDGGFGDTDAVEAALRSYAEDVGVAIDWARPERSVEGEETTEVFSDPAAGLNASASLVTSGEQLVAVRFSLAL